MIDTILERVFKYLFGHKVSEFVRMRQRNKAHLKNGHFQVKLL